VCPPPTPSLPNGEGLSTNETTTDKYRCGTRWILIEPVSFPCEQVCGSFHCEKRLGIVEWVEALRATPTKQLVITMYPEKDCHQFVPSRHAGRGDFVVLTDGGVKRSHDYMA
jgi:hypothetical protein